MTSADVSGLDELGLRLRDARIAAGISGRELARRVGVSNSVISHIENGKKLPSLPTMIGFARVLDVSIDELCGL